VAGEKCCAEKRGKFLHARLVSYVMLAVDFEPNLRGGPTEKWPTGDVVAPSCVSNALGPGKSRSNPRVFQRLKNGAGQTSQRANSIIDIK